MRVYVHVCVHPHAYLRTVKNRAARAWSHARARDARSPRMRTQGLRRHRGVPALARPGGRAPARERGVQ